MSMNTRARLIGFILVVLGLTPVFSYSTQTFLIVANGPYEDEVVQELAKDRVVIVLDGAANHLQKIIPEYILGDFDSITPETKLRYQNLGVKFIEAEDQSCTDLEKGIIFARELGAESIDICCALGGLRTDHSIGNLSILRSAYKRACPITLHTLQEMICFIKDESFCFKGIIGGQCSFFGWPRATVTTFGLVWDVIEWETEVGGAVSSCNLIKDPCVWLEVQGEILLIRPKDADVLDLK